MKKYFTITTNHETAKTIESLRNSTVMLGRSLIISEIDYNVPEYAIVKIEAAEGFNFIIPEDIFWLGFFSGTSKSRNDLIDK